MKLYERYRSYVYNIKDFDDWLRETYNGMTYLNWCYCAEYVKADIFFSFVKDCEDMKVK